MTISLPTPSLISPLQQRIFSRHDLTPPKQDILWRIERGAVRTVTWSEQGKLIDIGVTHQEIAEVINTTRVSVTRMLQQFEEQGMLLRHQRRLILLPTEQIKL